MRMILAMVSVAAGVTVRTEDQVGSVNAELASLLRMVGAPCTVVSEKD